MAKLSRRLNSLNDNDLWLAVASFKKSRLLSWLSKRMAAAGFPLADVLALRRSTKKYLVELAVDEIRDPW